MLQRRMTSRDFTELVAYYNRNPHWTERLYFYLAQVAFVVYAANIQNFSDKTLTLDDFVFDFTPDAPGKPKQSDEEMRIICQALADLFPRAAYNGEHQQDSNDHHGEHGRL